MIGVRLKLMGVPKMVRTLVEIDKKVCREALGDAINESTKPILKDAKEKVPVDTKLLKKSLGRKKRSFKSGSVQVGVVGVRKHFKGKKGQRVRTDKFRVRIGTDKAGKPIYVDPTNYAHLVEFGTKPHSLGKGDKLKRKGRKHKEVQTGARHPGTKRQPFLRPALDKNKSGTKAIMRKVLGDAIRAQKK